MNKKKRIRAKVLKLISCLLGCVFFLFRFNFWCAQNRLENGLPTANYAFRNSTANYNSFFCCCCCKLYDFFFSFSISFFLSCINWRHLRRKLFWRLRKKKRCVDEANTKPTESIQEVCDWFMHTSFKSHKQIYMENANAFKYLTLAFDQGMAQFSATHLFAFGISSSSSCLLGMKILLGTLSGWKLVGAQCIMCKNYKLAHEKVKFASFRCFSTVAANLLFSEMSKWSRIR